MDQSPQQQASGQQQDTAAAGAKPARTTLWKRSVGVAAMVAVLIVGSAGAAGASPAASRSTAVQPNGSAAGDDQPVANLHGTFSVVNLDRSVQPRQWQWGQVTAIDDVSFTVRSADGFSATYLIGPGVSVTGVAVGDTVTVVGAGPAS